jgi:two-component system, cell cycle response regulator
LQPTGNIPRGDVDYFGTLIDYPSAATLSAGKYMKILVLHNTGFYRTTLKTLLEAWGYDVVLATDGYEAQQIIEAEDAPRVAILDALMPGLSGFELCERIRAQQHNYVYVIFVSSEDQQSSVVKAYESGADDFVTKPFDNCELKLQLKVAERILHSQQVLVDAREAMKFEASHDPLVRLWNRKAILNLLTVELSRAKRLRTPLSVFFADLDHFKRINDRYGHLVGDEVLRNSAVRMSGEMREYDHLGRYGGEEFLAVLPNCNAEAARVVAERVRRSLAEKPILTDPARVEITISIGVSEWRPGQELPELLEFADLALYRAKDSGRNRIEVEDGAEFLRGALFAESGSRDAAQAGSQAQSGDIAGEQRPIRSAECYTNTEKIRQMRRLALDRQLQIITLHEGKPELVHGRIKNISEHGLGAVIPRCLDVDEKVTLNFYMEDGQQCTVLATVRHCNGLHIGFEFVSVEPSLREAIARVCGPESGGGRAQTAD